MDRWSGLRFWKKRKSAFCPLCRGKNIGVFVSEDNEKHWRKEEYFCRDCDCEWDWTFERPFFRWRARIRAPKWLEIE